MAQLFGLPFLPLIGGFIFLIFFNRTKIRSYRYSGYKLLFYSALLGLIGDLASVIIINTYSVFVLPLLAKNSAIISFLTQISQLIEPYRSQQLLAFILLTIAWIPLNLFFQPNIAAKNAILNLGTYLEKLLLEAQEKDQLISVTLKNHKVYVGYVIEAAMSFRPFDNQNSYLVILPVLSGFRRNSNQQAILTTRYYEMWGNESLLTKTGLTPEDFTLIIPENEVVSVNKFDYFIYEQFRIQTNYGENI